MLPSLKVKSLQHGLALGGSALGGGGMRWFDQPTRVRLSCLWLRTSVVLAVPVIPQVASAQDPLIADRVVSNATIAEASANVSIRVNRVGASLDCPDASQIRDALLRYPAGNPPAKLQLVIEFQKPGAASVATIAASGARSGTRELRLGSPDCQALLNPLVVSLTLLLDPDARMNVNGPGPTSTASPAIAVASASELPGSPHTVSTRTLPPAARESENEQSTFARAPGHFPNPTSSRKREFGLGIDIGPEIAVGLVPQVAYGLELQFAASYSFLSLRMAAAGFAPEELSYGEAKIRGRSYFGRLGLCAQANWRRAVLLSICQGTWLGRLSVKSHGLATDRSSEPLFWALGGHGEVSYLVSDQFGAFLRAGAFVPFTQHHFNIEGLAAPVFRSQAFGAWFGTGISWKFL